MLEVWNDVCLHLEQLLRGGRMLPDYVIYEELQRRKELEELEQPHLELPLYRIPLWPESEHEDEERHENSDVIIIQM